MCVREMNIDNSVLHGNKELLKCDRERQEENETCMFSRELKERQRSESFRCFTDHLL